MSSSTDTIAEALKSISTPSKVEAGIGTLEFTDGYPKSETA